MEAPRGKKAKDLGAYYTDRRVANFLSSWAIRHPQDRVIDSSFGGGVFLEAAAERLEQLRGFPKNIYGVELDTNVHAQISLELHGRCGIQPNHLLQADFFDIEPKQLPRFDAAVGNPPFIRYQGFQGSSREKALYQAKKQGVQLNSLASSWAAFIVHATAFLKEGGRLAMVTPTELGHAKYARVVLEFLLESFGKVSLLTFKEALFPKLSQDTLLLLAEEKGKSSSHLFLEELDNINALNKRRASRFKAKEGILTSDFLQNAYTLKFYSLPKDVRELYKRLASSATTKRLGELAQVGIGYVSGANHFFHVSKTTARQWKLSKHVLIPAVYKTKAFRGLGFTLQDWQQAEQNNDAGFLLNIQGKHLSKSLKNYIEYGESQNIHQAYKCRVRSAWYKVPHVYQADAFLSYMSSSRAQLVANHAKAVAPNTLHIVRLKDNLVNADDLSVLWQNSLTMLSTEIEGHALGGGMLKLEPSEARQVLVPWGKVNISQAFRLELDNLLRKDKIQQAIQFANKTLLVKGLGLSLDEVDMLLNAADHLRKRRG